ncbi:Cobyric acid synthase [Pelagimonas phthalicica]|uniref:Cobyric acid synthase n=1 Tax=Pelagimonas phthalicica TaxID=1037362 RepID=A0A238JES7_9RHOB|nr:cobyric acid synthase [Pelagimonas phthalicica]SMX28336.1 Cobyric acid synthase [Pelagimonas phthalicica]
MSKALMIQGAGSNVGKSMLVAGLCRAARNRGLSVAPFKPQNMSNNAAVTADGGEIGRAQALQAQACGLEPHTDMNPILLKPETDVGAQVVVQGRRLTTCKAREYSNLKPRLMESVLDSFTRLRDQHDLVLVEGAGSPAEVNLRAGDIANMGFACAANVPVLLAGDIDRGGVFAQIKGTQAVLDDQDNAQIKGFLINKFRGDPSLFEDGYKLIETITGWQGYGVLPFFADAYKLPAEDALDLPKRAKGQGLRVVCLRLSRIANFDDLDPLAQEPDVDLTMLSPGEAIPGDTDLVILPGSKSTRGDLAFLRAQGWDIDLQAHVRRGGHVLGICGGYQMLGTVISDPQGIEGLAGRDAGLGLLQVETEMTDDKRLTRVAARHADSGAEMSGYEIHIGRSDGPDRDRPFAFVDGTAEGAQSSDGKIMGTYLHGLFSSDQFRKAFVERLGGTSSVASYAQTVDETLDVLAEHMCQHIDVDGILALAR